MTSDMTTILTIVLSIMVSVLFVLVIAYVAIVLRKKHNEKMENEKEEELIKTGQEQTTKKIRKEVKQYTEKPIGDFLEFDTVVDNMIQEDKGKKFVMVIKCQGINYDLMSGIEKTAVEQGFIEFLNTLRHPIQIYIQTQKVDLTKSIDTYRNRLSAIQDEYAKQRLRYNRMVESNSYSKEELASAWYELTKQSNLLEYGRDVINNTEKMSLNSNVLRKDYYIIIPYYTSELGNSQYDQSEIRSIAFSELYTKAQSIIRTLLSCNVSAKVLNSDELTDLLYVVYNREDSEVFGIEKAQAAGYDELYSTAPDVLDKKMEELDKEIEKRAIILANQKLQEVKDEKEREVEEKELSIEELAREMAKVILANNKAALGKKDTEKAIEKIDEEGGKTEDVKEKKTKRVRNSK